MPRLTYIGGRYTLKNMKTISVHVNEASYLQLRSLAARSGKPVAHLIREAMDQFLLTHQDRPSLLQLRPHESGPLLASWTREELADEMRES